jgi:hypothetical protein
VATRKIGREVICPKCHRLFKVSAEPETKRPGVEDLAADYFLDEGQQQNPEEGQ